MLEKFDKHGVYQQVVSYKSVRCCRILPEAAGKRFKDCIEDFEVFKGMSPHMRTVLGERGTADFKTCMKFVEALKGETGLRQATTNL